MPVQMRNLHGEYPGIGTADDLCIVRHWEQDWVTNLATINRDYCVCFSFARRKKEKKTHLSISCQERKREKDVRDRELQKTNTSESFALQYALQTFWVLFTLPREQVFVCQKPFFFLPLFLYICNLT